MEWKKREENESNMEKEKTGEEDILFVDEELMGEEWRKMGVTRNKEDRGIGKEDERPLKRRKKRGEWRATKDTTWGQREITDEELIVKSWLAGGVEENVRETGRKTYQQQELVPWSSVKLAAWEILVELARARGVEKECLNRQENERKENEKEALEHSGAAEDWLKDPDIACERSEDEWLGGRGELEEHEYLDAVRMSLGVRDDLVESSLPYPWKTRFFQCGEEYVAHQEIQMILAGLTEQIDQDTGVKEDRYNVGLEQDIVADPRLEPVVKKPRRQANIKELFKKAKKKPGGIGVEARKGIGGGVIMELDDGVKDGMKGDIKIDTIVDNYNLTKNLILTGPDEVAGKVERVRRDNKDHTEFGTEFEAENINTKDLKKIHHHLLPSKGSIETKCLTGTTSQQTPARVQAAEGVFQTEVSQGAPEVLEQVARLPGEKGQVMGQYREAEQKELVTGDRVQQLVRMFEPAEMVGLVNEKEVNKVSKESRMSGKVMDTSRKKLVACRKPRLKKPVGCNIEKVFVQSRLVSFVGKMGFGLLGELQEEATGGHGGASEVCHQAEEGGGGP